MELDGKVVVITGAGSGIGRALCQTAAAKGATVVGADIDESTAKETVERLAPGSAAGEHRPAGVDVADRDAVHRLADEVLSAFGRVDVVVNNAGVLGQVAPIDQLDYEQLEWIVGIDLWGVIHGTKAFLPHLKARPAAALVNVSSLAGLMGSLGNSAYFAAKFGVRGFTEAIRSECRGTGVRVTVVHPGIVRTNLAASYHGYSEAERRRAVQLYHSQPGVSPQRAARRIAAAIEKGKPRLLIGPDAWFADKLVRVAPGRYDRLLSNLVRRAANKQRPDGRQVF